MPKVLHREACPACTAKGEDTSGDNLAVYVDGVYCFACGYSGEQSSKKKKKAKLVELPDTRELLKGIEHKSIGFKATNAFMVAQELDETDHPTGWVVFPNYTLEKVLVGVKYRSFIEEKRTGKKAVYFDGEPDLWGLHLYDPTVHRRVILWEGETDVMSGWLYDSSYLHLGTGGTGLVEQLIRKNSMFLRGFDAIYIAFDNDKAGREATDVAIDLLPRYKTFIVHYPNTLSVKDVNEMWAGSVPPSVFTEMIRMATPVGSQDLLTGDGLVSTYQKYDDNYAQFGYLSTGHKAIDMMVGGGMSPAELIVLFGPTGIGKSTFALDVAMNIAFNLKGGQTVPVDELSEREGSNIMWVGTEMVPTQNIRKMMERLAGCRYLEDGQRQINQEDRETLALAISDRVVFYNAMAGLFERVADAIITAIHQYGVRAVFIDVLNDIDDGFSNWERAAEIMRQLGKLTQGDLDDNRPPITIVVVCHTKGEDITEGVTLSDIKGGSAVRQQATCILSIEGDRELDIRTLRLQKKSRMQDADFGAMNIIFNRTTRQYEEQVRGSNKRESASQRSLRTQEVSGTRKLRAGLVHRERAR